MFDTFPDEARLWAYGFSSALTPMTEPKVRTALAQFIAGWTSHEAPVRGEVEILHGRFALIAAETPGGPSGCSIDKSVSVFKSLQSEGLDALDRGLVFYRDEKTIAASTREEFRRRVLSGKAGPGTAVFDLTLQCVGDFRGGRFELPFEKSWHSKVFTPALT